MGKKAREIIGMDLKNLLTDLNKAYCDEWLAYYSYLHMARTVSGPGYEDMGEFLEKIAKDEAEHIEELATRITELGGMPLANPAELGKTANYPYPIPPRSTDDYDAMIKVVTDSEGNAITVYHKLAQSTFGKDNVTYQLVTHILAEEVTHEEMFENLLSSKQAAAREMAEPVGAGKR